MNSLSVYKLRCWLPPSLWAVLIFGLSCWSGPQDDMPFIPGADKAAHFVLFGVLAMLLYRALILDSICKPIPAVFLTFALTVLYAISDEWHQSFVATRSAEMLDLAADAVGGLAGAVTGWKLSARYIVHQNTGRE